MEEKIRIGNYIYIKSVVRYYPYYDLQICGEVKMGIDGEYINWYH